MKRIHGAGMFGCLLGLVGLAAIIWLPKPVLTAIIPLMVASWLLKRFHST